MILIQATEAAIFGLLVNQLIGFFYFYPRPYMLGLCMPLIPHTSETSFPSGHTTMIVILYGFLAIMVTREGRNALRWGVFGIVLLISFMIAFSRLYLGVHWLSDVLGGFLLASAWIALTGIVYLRGPSEIVPRRLLGLVTLVVFFTVGCWHVADRHPKDLAFYAPRRTIQLMGLRTWLENGWEKLPAWRIDLGGEREQPLTIQWADSPERMAQYLFSKGWHSPPALNLKTFLFPQTITYPRTIHLKEPYQIVILLKGP
jgi:hypothetical protein